MSLNNNQPFGKDPDGNILNEKNDNRQSNVKDDFPPQRINATSNEELNLEQKVNRIEEKLDCLQTTCYGIITKLDNLDKSFTQMKVETKQLINALASSTRNEINNTSTKAVEDEYLSRTIATCKEASVMIFKKTENSHKLLGSGFIVDIEEFPNINNRVDGVDCCCILTAKHVVQDFLKVPLNLCVEHNEWPAGGGIEVQKIVPDLEYDVAILWVKKECCSGKPIMLCDNETKLGYGQQIRIIATSNPENPHRVLTGNISDPKNKKTNPYDGELFVNYIDCNIRGQEGFSGCPGITADGKVFGMLKCWDKDEELTLFIPAETLRKVLAQEHNRVVSDYIQTCNTSAKRHRTNPPSVS
uniref:Peptidase S1 domain-containing protein n=1 Tax=Ciona savignyi TaxID=51511 RepID=H2ZLG2_CIOSA